MSGLPNSKHHGVGFFVSPNLRSHVKDFKPHSPRICEITIDTLPHPTTIVNLYAPSTVETPETDRQQKAQFWADLEDLMIHHPNSSNIVLVGDCNSRLDANIDPTYTQVGPQVVGRRQTIPEPERDNAIHLMDFLEAHGCYLPQTFSDLPFRQKVTYKEMTCADHTLLAEDVQQWTALDYLVLPQSLRQVVTFSGSIFQQLINTRHLPLTFTIQTQYLQKPPEARRSRYDYTQLSTLYECVETSLLSITGHEFPSTDLTQPRIIAYTDGSCPNNRVVSFDNPAGWGFALTLSHSPAQHPPTNPHWYQSWGPVKTNPTDIVHPLPGSNNTGELKAIIELFDYLLYYSPFPAIDQLTIFTDSQYVLSILQGDAVPITHHRLATVAQKYYTAIRCKYRTFLQKVSSHVGIPGNELADTLAKRGVHSRSSLGRFAPPTLQSLTPPDINFNHSQWTCKTTNEQDEMLQNLFTSNLPLIPLLPQSAKKPWISPDTLKKIDKFQHTTFTDVAALKQARKHIKKAARNDKKKLLPATSFLTSTEAPFNNGHTPDRLDRTSNPALQDCLTLRES